MEPAATSPTRSNPLETREPAAPSRGHLMEAAYQLIKERLLEGKYAAGERVVPEEVMSYIDASRQPVMDAMRRLATEGFLNIVPQVGCLVAQPDAQQISDFLRMLASIEGTCIELACERASDEEIQALQHIVVAFEAKLLTLPSSADLAHEFRVHNRVFHDHLHTIAHAEIVRELAVSLNDRADFYIGSAHGAHSFAVRNREVIEEHRRIAEVLSWRDALTARRIIEMHVLAFIDSLGPSTLATAASKPRVKPRAQARKAAEG